MSTIKSGKPSPARKAKQPKKMPNKVPEDVNEMQQEPVRMPPTFVVGIGASAGGLEAVEAFFRSMPSDSGMTFVVIQHLSPDFKSLMKELLARFTNMPMISVMDDVVIQPNTVYLLAPKKDMVIEADRLITIDRPSEKRLSLPINQFFRSLAAAWGDRSIGIILSGTGSDGSSGIMDIRENGGLVLVQSLESSRFDGMPRSAINTGCVDLILPPESMPDAIRAYAKNPHLEADYGGGNRAEVSAPEGIPTILQCLKDVYDIDFNYYRPGTITRRVERRVLLHPEHLSVAEYGQKVKSDPQELAQLYKDLLIGVTRFFRDPEAFRILANQIIPGILESRMNDTEVRVWVCGCSTGEEAYSIAILFLEAFEAYHQIARIKILATDLHRESLQIAADGCYSESSLEEMPKELREKYFIEQPSGLFRVTANLRKVLIFSEHNLLKDPPFTKLDLVSCRNLLIYLETAVQQRAIAAFHFALKVGGTLLLGHSEGVGDLTPEFDIVDKRWKLFSKVRENRFLADLRLPLHNENIRTPRVTASATIGDPALGRVYDNLLNIFIPDGILVNHRNEAVHVFGNARNYLNPPSGRVRPDIFTMVEGHLRIAFMIALRNAQQQNVRASYRGIQVRRGEKISEIDLEVVPIVDDTGRTQHYMLLLKECEPLALPTAISNLHSQLLDRGRLSNQAISHVENLESELLRVRESLQTTIEELETSNEELQATNEEMLASNEELQSTNEELHSVNEELYSVNSEHEAKIQELNQVTSDLNNLIRSTELATIFIDQHWEIRLYSPVATQIFPLLPQDIGRSIQHLTPLEPDPTLKDDLQQVFDTQKMHECTIPWGNRRSYLRRITPYQDANNNFAGLVITYIDVSETTSLKARIRAIFNSSPNGMLLINGDTQKIEMCNPCVEKIFGYEQDELLGHDIDFLVPKKLRMQHSKNIQNYLEHPIGRPMGVNREVWGQRKDGSTFPAEVSLNPLLDSENHAVHVTIVDITNRRQAQDELVRAKLEAEAANLAKSQFLATMSHEIRTPMNGILGMAQLMQELDISSEERQEYSQVILKSGRHLMNLLNEILDLSKVEAGRLVLDNQKFDPLTILQEVEALFRAPVDVKGLKIFSEWRNPDRAHEYIADPMRMRQMLTNLVSNAVKFTQHGSIIIVGEQLETTPSDALLRFTVTDTGIGIPRDRQSEIFSPFYQVDGSNTRQYQGSGLGLSIVRKLALLMGGDAGFISEVGRGSTFWFTFKATFPRSASNTPSLLQGDEPLADVLEKNSLAAAPFHAGEKKHILIVDDEQANAKVLETILVRMGLSCSTVADGEQAVQVVCTQHDRYHTVIMDCQMPVMDGMEATRRIREWETQHQMKRVPIIALTANAFSSDRQACLDAGMDDFMTKPFDILNLQVKLEHWLISSL